LSPASPWRGIYLSFIEWCRQQKMEGDYTAALDVWSDVKCAILVKAAATRLFNFQWLAPPDEGSLFLLFTPSSRADCS